MALSLYRPTGNIGPFKNGEIVEIDPTQWQDYIEGGWLVKADPPRNPIAPPASTESSTGSTE